MTRGKSWHCFIDALLAMKKELMDMGIFDRNRVYFENYALHSCLWNLGTLPEQAVEKLSDCLIDRYFSILGISQLKEEEIEFQREKDIFSEFCRDRESGIEMSRKAFRPQEKQQGVGKPQENTNLTGEEYYRYCLDEIRKSKSYKIGLAVTWLPRKIRGW